MIDGIREREASTESIQDIFAKISKLDIVSDSKYNEKIGEVSSELIEYYKRKGRHQYSEVSAFLNEIGEEDIEYLTANIEAVKAFIETYDKENLCEYYQKVLKLEDHIKLEILRISKWNELKKLSNEVSDKVENFEKNVGENEKKSEQVIDNINGLNSQIISMIGIFSAVVITFFGGINFIEGILNSIDKVSKYRFVFSILITGFIMFNTIFMLLNFIAKITGKNIRTKCKHLNSEGECNGCKKWIIRCVKSKHPTVFWINLLLIIAMVIIVILYYSSRILILMYGKVII